MTEARARGYAELTLTTYADVPWNAPFYAARGFAVVDDPAPYLQRQRAHEQEQGYDRHGPRVAMSRPAGCRSRRPRELFHASGSAPAHRAMIPP